jgi:hypothetical protein
MPCPKRTNTIKFSARSFVPKTTSALLKDVYEIDFDDDKIEEGIKSVVYKCVHKETGTQRAVKVVEKSRWNDEENDKTRNKFNLLSLMEHPNIVKVYESFEGDTHFYIVTDYCHGGE